MEIQFRTQFGELLAHLGLKGDAVEIGVAEGRNALSIIQSSQVERLYLIDSWKELKQKGDGGFPQDWHDINLRVAQETLEPYKEKAIWLRGLSQDMIDSIPDDSLVFAYLDGDHSYQGCLSDLVRIYKKVKVGGVIAGHDYINEAYGVNKAVKYFVFENGNYRMSDIHQTQEGGDDSMVSFWFIKKEEDADSI